MKSRSNTSAAPRRHRILIWLLGGAMSLLSYWLLGFIMSDIGSLPGPDYTELEDLRLDQTLVDRDDELSAEIASAKRDSTNLQTTQSLLRESISSSQRTLNQLMDVQKLALEKGVEFSDEQQQAMTENIQLFLASQQRDQQLNGEISQLNEQQQNLESQHRTVTAQLDAARDPIRDEYQQLVEQHEFKMGGFKLLILVPLLVVSVAVLFRLKSRASLYLPLACAVGTAISLKVGFVMHEHFPTRYFKYVLIATALGIVTVILTSLLRAVAFPKRSWLLKQYREAYEAFLCPKCEYPIRRGPMRFLSWTRSSIRKVRPSCSDSIGQITSEPYTCPMCATSLFRKCEKCDQVRHSLLPACEHCGETTDIEESQSGTTDRSSAVSD